MSEEDVNSDQLSVNPSSLRYDATSSQQSTVNSDKSVNSHQPPVTSGDEESTSGTPAIPAKTQGVRGGRADGGRRALERAARAAAKTGKRGDVHAYMRIRRGYV